MGDSPAASEAPQLFARAAQLRDHEIAPRDRYRDARLLTILDRAVIADAGNGFRHTAHYFGEAFRRVLAALAKPPALGALEVHRIYNTGVVIRTADVCIAIDVVVPPDCHAQVEEFVNRLDMLFVTHEHPDHLDAKSPLLSLWKQTGKPLIASLDRPELPVGGLVSEGEHAGVSWACHRGIHWVNQVYSGTFRIQIAGRVILHSGDNTRWLALSKQPDWQGADLFLFKPECLPDEDVKGMRQLETWPEVLKNLCPRRIVPHHLLEVLGHGLGAYSHLLSLHLQALTPLPTDVISLLEGEKLTL